MDEEDRVPDIATDLPHLFPFPVRIVVSNRSVVGLGGDSIGYDDAYWGEKWLRKIGYYVWDCN